MYRSWTDDELRAAVASAASVADVLRALGLRSAGGNHRSISRHIARLGIDTSHFDPARAQLRNLHQPRKPLCEVLVEHSDYHRGNLKRRLFGEGIKERRCEQCGQGEEWRGRTMSLILDHINGVHDDNRLENLQIVCPNCAATLDTHCGKQLARRRESKPCVRCGTVFLERNIGQRFCSRDCATRGVPGERAARYAALRRVDRPPLDELRARIEVQGYCAVAREYGISDNAIRKWFRSAGEDPPRRYVRRRSNP